MIRAFNDDKPYAPVRPGADRRRRALPRHDRRRDRARASSPPGRGTSIGHVEVPETKIDGKVARHLDRDDMVANTMNTFVSLTVQCAQLPQPQVRSDHAGGLLPPAGGLRRGRPGRPAVRRRPAAPRSGAANWSAQRAELQKRQDELDAKMKTLGGEATGQAGREDRRTQASRARRRPEFGYHSAHRGASKIASNGCRSISARRSHIDEIVMSGCHDDFNNIGAGFGFPVRFKVELSDDAEFKTASPSSRITRRPTSPIPASRPQIVLGRRRAGRYVRVTATQACPAAERLHLRPGRAGGA